MLYTLINSNRIDTDSALIKFNMNLHQIFNVIELSLTAFDNCQLSSILSYTHLFL